MIEPTVTLTHDAKAQCWRYQIFGNIDGNTRFRLSGESKTREAARKAIAELRWRFNV